MPDALVVSIACTVLAIIVSGLAWIATDID